MTVLVVLYIIYSAWNAPNATKTHLHAVVYPLPQRIRTYLAKTAQNVNKDTYESTKKQHTTPPPTDKTRPHRQKAR